MGTILPHVSQILFYLTQRADMTDWIVFVSFLVEDEVQKLQKRRPEEVKLVGDPIISR